MKSDNILSDNELANIKCIENLIVLRDNRDYNILSHRIMEKLLFDVCVNEKLRFRFSKKDVYIGLPLDFSMCTTRKLGMLSVSPFCVSFLLCVYIFPLYR